MEVGQVKHAVAFVLQSYVFKTDVTVDQTEFVEFF
jgi:hypothetical protein